MKKIRALCLLFSLLLTALCVAPAAAAESVDKSVVSGCHSVDAALSLSDEAKLTETAKAAIIYELGSDTMIYAYNPDGRIYPASMVKLMTALVALENGNLDDKVLVTKRALSNWVPGSVSAGLEAGEELTLRDLLYCLMTASANDAALVIAEHIGGTQDTFVKMLNEKAAALGCTGTAYTNAHGLHDEGTYTTARDICRILDHALDIPEFQEMFCAEHYTVPATNKQEAREIYTSNHMMSRHSEKRYFDSRVTGGKTGATDEAGRCLAATAKCGDMELLTIVMGAEPEYEEDKLSLKSYGSFEETKILLDHAAENYEFRQVFFDGQTVSQFPVIGGENSVVTRPVKTASTVLPVQLDESKLTWIYGDTVGQLTAPIAEGEKITTVQVWYGAKCLAQSDLVAANAVKEFVAPTDPAEPQEEEPSQVWKWVGIVAAAVLGIAAVLVLIRTVSRFIRRAMVNARRRRRRENRRRSR
jgi:D-alanyl-D-alanine carboxypeptidase (penicillin-binding protein 5/6)